jgi:hypothetical protein
MFRIYLRPNSDLCHLPQKLIGFNSRDEKCLQRGTDWVFKYSSLRFVFKGLIHPFSTVLWTGPATTQAAWHQSGLYPRPVWMGFMADEVSLWQVSLPVLLFFFPLVSIPPVLQTHLYHYRCVITATISVFKNHASKNGLTWTLDFTSQES